MSGPHASRAWRRGVLVLAAAGAIALAAGRRIPVVPPPEANAVAGFTFVGWCEWSAPNDIEGVQTHTVALYRADAYARALGVPPQRWAEELGPAYVDTEFVRLPPAGDVGEFALGSPPDEHARDSDETPRTIAPTPFLLARTETSQRVYAALGGSLQPCRFAGPRRPVEGTSWDEAAAFCTRLGLRLPAENEWELACRGGTGTPFYTGSRLDPHAANHDSTGPYRSTEQPQAYRAHTTDVGSFPPNGYGVFDLHGNVWEWCADLHALSATHRVARGGGWVSYARFCRSAYRASYAPHERAPYRGFRAARSLP